MKELLGIDEKFAAEFEEILQNKPKNSDEKSAKKTFGPGCVRESSEFAILRPGCVRLSFPYFMEQKEIDYVCKAIAMVAEKGWKLLPQVNLVLVLVLVPNLKCIASTNSTCILTITIININSTSTITNINSTSTITNINSTSTITNINSTSTININTINIII